MCDTIQHLLLSNFVFGCAFISILCYRHSVSHVLIYRMFANKEGSLAACHFSDFLNYFSGMIIKYCLLL